MPNHVTTIIKSSNQDLVKSLKDFNQIIKMPKIFDEFGNGICMFFEIDDFIDFVKSQNLTNIDKDVLKKLAAEFAPYNDVLDRDKDEFILQAYCYFEIGYKNPIDWARANWNTKWNSYYFELTYDGCKFDTAWTHPYSIIKKLSEMYPDDEIEVKYADEDIGYNLGHYKIKNSHIEIIFDEDKQSMKDRKWFALCVKGSQNEYVWSEKDDDYIYVDDLEK